MKDIKIYSVGSLVYDERFKRIITIVAKKCGKIITKKLQALEIQPARKILYVEHIIITSVNSLEVLYSDGLNVFYNYDILSPSLAELISKLSVITKKRKNYGKFQREILKFEKKLIKYPFNFYKEIYLTMICYDIL